MNRATSKTSGFTGTLILEGARNGEGNNFGEILFYNYDSQASDEDFVGASISAFSDGVDDGGLKFSVANNKVIKTAIEIDKNANVDIAGDLTTHSDITADKFLGEVESSNIIYEDINNVKFGQAAGSHMTQEIGAFNSYFGTSAGYANHDGSLNTFIGSYAGQNVRVGSNNVFLGHYAGGKYTSASERLVIANTSTDNPLIYGEFDNQLLKVNGTIESSTGFIGDGSRLTGIEMDVSELIFDQISIGPSTPTASLSIKGVGSSDNIKLIDFHESDTEASEFYIEGDFQGTGGSGNKLKLRKCIASRYHDLDRRRIRGYRETNLLPKH